MPKRKAVEETKETVVVFPVKTKQLTTQERELVLKTWSTTNTFDYNHHQDPRRGSHMCYCGKFKRPMSDEDYEIGIEFCNPEEREEMRCAPHAILVDGLKLLQSDVGKKHNTINDMESFLLQYLASKAAVSCEPRLHNATPPKKANWLIARSLNSFWDTTCVVEGQQIAWYHRIRKDTPNPLSIGFEGFFNLGPSGKGIDKCPTTKFEPVLPILPWDNIEHLKDLGIAIQIQDAADTQ